MSYIAKCDINCFGTTCRKVHASTQEAVWINYYFLVISVAVNILHFISHLYVGCGGTYGNIIESGKFWVTSVLLINERHQQEGIIAKRAAGAIERGTNVQVWILLPIDD